MRRSFTLSVWHVLQNSLLVHTPLHVQDLGDIQANPPHNGWVPSLRCMAHLQDALPVLPRQGLLGKTPCGGCTLQSRLAPHPETPGQVTQVSGAVCHHHSAAGPMSCHEPKLQPWCFGWEILVERCCSWPKWHSNCSHPHPLLTPSPTAATP